MGWQGLGPLLSKTWNLLWHGYQSPELGVREKNIQQAEDLSLIAEKGNVILASGPFSNISYYSNSSLGRIASLFMRQNSEYLVNWSNNLSSNVVIHNDAERAYFEKTADLCDNQEQIYTSWSQSELNKTQKGNSFVRTIYKIINCVRPYIGLQNYEQIADEYKDIAKRFETVAFNIDQLIRNYEFGKIKGKLALVLPKIKEKINYGEWPLEYAQGVIIGTLEGDNLFEENQAVKDIYSNFISLFSNNLQILRNADPVANILDPISLVPLSVDNERNLAPEQFLLLSSAPINGNYQHYQNDEAIEIKNDSDSDSSSDSSWIDVENIDLP